MSLDIRYQLDPVKFAQEKLGFHPDKLKRTVLDVHARRGILNCSRQWGKSTLTAIEAVYRALTSESLINVVSPTERRSGEFVRKTSHKEGFRR